MKKALLKEVEEILAEAIEMSSTSSTVEHAIFRFNHMALTGMTHHELTNEIIHKSFER